VARLLVEDETHGGRRSADAQRRASRVLTSGCELVPDNLALLRIHTWGRGCDSSAGQVSNDVPSVSIFRSKPRARQNYLAIPSSPLGVVH